MDAQLLDQEFMQYWMRLSLVEKQSLFHVAKRYVELKDDTAPISIDQYNAEIDEAMKRMDDGEFYTHEQVVEMSKGWLNGK
jgi:predicted transcriptional regulator